MASNLLTSEVADVLTTVVDATDDLWVIDPTHRTIEAVVDVATGFEGSLPTIRLLATEATLKETFEDFLIASRTADLVADGALSIRTVDTEPSNSLLVTNNTVYALVTAGEQVAALATADDEFVTNITDSYEKQWAAAAEFQLRTPPLSSIRDSLAETIAAQVREDFDAIVSALDTARGDGEGLDEVTISLLVAAKNEVLLYDISKWGEDIGIASKATFSRTKTKLEETGVISTEKVPIDVGRPRLRLQLAADQLEAAEARELATQAEELL